jgi:pimeloyl-ACP methyl ester carboxylesterase
VALLVHGVPLDARMWQAQLYALAGRHRRVIAPDLRGHGASPWSADPVHSMDLLANDLLAFADAVEVESFDLVGLSMGGYVALALAAADPSRVRTLALLDTKAGPDTDDGKAARDETAAAVVREGRGWLFDKLSGVLLAERATDLVRGRLRTIVESQSYETIVADLAGMRDRPDQTELLRSLSMPAAVVVGAEDALTPPEVHEEMAGLLPDAKLTVVDDAGHMTPMEAPEAVDEALAALWVRGAQ